MSPDRAGGGEALRGGDGGGGGGRGEQHLLRLVAVRRGREGGAKGRQTLVTPAGGGDVVGVPLRVQAEPARDAAAGLPALVPTPDGDFWQATVQDLVTREAVTALVRELALQAQLVGRDEGHWMLRVERESLNQPAARDRLRTALEGAGHAVDLSVEVGAVTDSPARRQAHANKRRQDAAERVILADPFVQQMMRDFGARIVPGSIKPLDKP